MERNVPRADGTYIRRETIASQAFWDLNGVAIKVFMVFRLKCRIVKTSAGKKEIKNILNNGEIIFTFQEAWKKYGVPKSTFLRARDQLIKVGLIEIAEDGGCHHTTKYSISNNWRNYPEQTFERSKSGNLVGIKTRWKKDTVKSDTINQSSTVKSDTNSNSNGTENDA